MEGSVYIPLHWRSTPTLRAYYRCDKVIKDNLEGEILWTGPSEKHVLVIETDPQDFLHDSFLVDTMKKQIFNSLKQQPYVQALLQAGDTLGMAQCEILYQNNVAFISGLSEMEDNLSFNEEIDIDEDEMGTFASLWITMILIVNSQEQAHSVSPIRARLHLGPGRTYNCGDTGDIANNAIIKKNECNN